MTAAHLRPDQSVPALLGVLYAGTATILVDPYTGLMNTVRLHLELEALLHVRSAAGAT